MKKYTADLADGTSLVLTFNPRPEGVWVRVGLNEWTHTLLVRPEPKETVEEFRTEVEHQALRMLSLPSVKKAVNASCEITEAAVEFGKQFYSAETDVRLELEE